jgi:hypothetical protein
MYVRFWMEVMCTVVATLNRQHAHGFTSRSFVVSDDDRKSAMDSRERYIQWNTDDRISFERVGLLCGVFDF